MEIFLILLALILIFIAVLLIRAAAFKPKADNYYQPSQIDFDEDKAVENLCELVRFKTVSYRDSSLEDDAEFKKLTDSLPRLYPKVFEICEYKEFLDRAILLKWAGKSNSQPSVMMAHYDVVPVNESAWDKPPFEAVIENGVIWGRGTLDTKVTLNGILYAAEKLVSDGFIPENDVYFAFSGGEEVNGKGAARIVDYFFKNGITPALVVDEGGAVVENVFPGVNKPCGLIGIAEKGMMDVEYKTKSDGGHASAPSPHTPVGVLARGCARLENNPFKYHITKPVSALFDTLGRHSSFFYKIIFANIGLFGWALDLLCKKSGGELNALLRTTVAFTCMKGSSATNVIPTEATMISNIRLNPEDTVDSALEYIKSKVNDDNIEITCLHGMNPSRVSDIDCDAYNKVATAVSSTFDGCIVSPYLMVQCSDSRHYCRISDKVYRFSAMALTSEERATIHGNNERIKIDAVKKAVEFYIRLMSKC